MPFEAKSKLEKAEWLVANATQTDECLECHMSTDKDGYCQVGVSGSNYRAHRLVYEQLVGPLGTLQVLHSCDNPKCINIKHLFLGTQKDNMVDMGNKGRKANAGLATRALSEDAAREAFGLYHYGSASQTQLASKYRVNQSTISLTIKRLREECHD